MPIRRTVPIRSSTIVSPSTIRMTRYDSEAVSEGAAFAERTSARAAHNGTSTLTTSTRGGEFRDVARTWYRSISSSFTGRVGKRFYERCGFASSPFDPMTLVITVADAKKALSGK